MIQAKRVVGASIEVTPKIFENIMQKKKNGIIVTAKSGFFSKVYKYQAFYEGFTFFMSTPDPINISAEFTLVVAEKIYTPLASVS